MLYTCFVVHVLTHNLGMYQLMKKMKIVGKNRRF